MERGPEGSKKNQHMKGEGNKRKHRRNQFQTGEDVECMHMEIVEQVSQSQKSQLVVSTSNVKTEDNPHRNTVANP